MSATDRTIRVGTARLTRARGGFTLVESMMASVLLAASVIGVSGTILSSYAHDQQSIARRGAITAADSLMNELTALPFEPGSPNDVGLSDFTSYSDSSSSSTATVATAQKAQTKGKTTPTVTETNQPGLVAGLLGMIGGLLSGSSNTTTGGSSTPSATPVTFTNTIPTTTATRVVSVKREETIDGVATSTGKLAVVTVDATIGSGQTVRIRRLVSSAEAESSVAR